MFFRAVVYSRCNGNGVVGGIGKDKKEKEYGCDKNAHWENSAVQRF